MGYLDKLHRADGRVQFLLLPTVKLSPMSLDKHFGAIATPFLRWAPFADADCFS